MSTVCPSGVLVCFNTVNVNQVKVRLAVIPGPQGSATANVVNRQIQPPIVIEGLTVTGTLSGDNKKWTGQVQGPCPSPMKGVDNVAPDGMFTGERIDVAALQLAQLSITVPYDNLDETYIARLNEPCGIRM